MTIDYDVIRSTLRELRWHLLAPSGGGHLGSLSEPIEHALDALAALRTPEGERWLRSSAVPRIADPGRWFESVRFELLLGAALTADDEIHDRDLAALAN